MTKVALLGAGGKMGVRLATNLKGSHFNVAHVEVSEAGRQRLKDVADITCVDENTALQDADVVVLAVPDRKIGEITHAIIDRLRSGAAIIVLDAAAPYAGKMPVRSDVTYFVTHPCHPPLFGGEVDPDAQRDFFGGIKAKQAIVCALMQGPEEHYQQCEKIARTIFAPVSRVHRCTVENLAVLEPALSETVGATLCTALREATDEAVHRGVPRGAALDFMLGHLNIELAILFDVFQGRFSDGAMQAIRDAKPLILQEDWLERVFNPEALKESVRAICDPKEPVQSK
jgi:hypothetical protein